MKTFRLLGAKLYLFVCFYHFFFSLAYVFLLNISVTYINFFHLTICDASIIIMKHDNMSEYLPQIVKDICGSLVYWDAVAPTGTTSCADFPNGNDTCENTTLPSSNQRESFANLLEQARPPISATQDAKIQTSPMMIANATLQMSSTKVENIQPVTIATQSVATQTYTRNIDYSYGILAKQANAGAFLDSIVDLPMDQKASAINGRLYEKIIIDREKMSNDQILKEMVTKTLLNDCSTDMWRRDSSLINVMLKENSCKIQTVSILADEKKLLSHINSQLEMIFLAGDRDPLVALKKEAAYNQFYLKYHDNIPITRKK